MLVIFILLYSFCIEFTLKLYKTWLKMKKNEKKKHGFFQRGFFFEKSHWVQSDRTQSGPPWF